MVRKRKMYISADWEHDKDAVNQIYKWKNDKGWDLELCDTHELTETSGISCPCLVKTSMRYTLDDATTLVLIVGDHTAAVTKGECQHCVHYNSYIDCCEKDRFMDNRDYITWECEKSVRTDKKIIVLYKSTCVDKTKCPPSVRDVGTHVAMVHKGQDNRKYWDYNAVKEALEV